MWIFFDFCDILFIVGEYMKKDGFISMAVVYSFIIVFLLVMVSLLSLYSYRNKLIQDQVTEVKSILNKEYR